MLYASTNPGKLAEVRSLAMARGVKVLDPAGLGLAIEVVEDEDTFEGNALLKARAYAALAPGHIILGDDTGLRIDALDGEPGVFTRRWADRVHEMSDGEIIAYALERMEGVVDRSAHMVTCVAVRFPTGREELVSGRLDGEILEVPRGECIPGLPVGSLLYVPEWGMTLGEAQRLPIDLLAGKPTHRARAFAAALDVVARDPASASR